MKKVIIMAAACMISVAALGQVTFGIKGGANFSRLTGTEGKNETFFAGFRRISKTALTSGLHFGGYANYSFNDVLGAQAEAVFSVQGGRLFEGDYVKNEVGNALYRVYWVQRMYYFNVPVLLDIKPFQTPLSFFIGPQFGCCLNRTFSNDHRMGEHRYSDFKDFDFTAVLGVQYTVMEHLTLGLRYNCGLTPSFAYDYDYHYEYELNGEIITENSKGTFKGYRNSVVQLSVGWTF